MMTKIDQFRNNCTLVAVREVTGGSDEEIIRRFEEKGWKRGRGTHSSLYINVIREMGFEAEHVNTRLDGRKMGGFKVTKTGREYFDWASQYMTLAAFCKANSVGVFVVQVDGHALVVRAGKMVDPNVSTGTLRRRVLNAWLVKNAAGSHHLVAEKLTKKSAIEFRGRSKRQRKAAARTRESEAVMFLYKAHLNNRKVTLADVVANTSYTMADAQYDFKRGRLVTTA